MFAASLRNPARRPTRPARPALQVETLEDRAIPSVSPLTAQPPLPANVPALSGDPIDPADRAATVFGGKIGDGTNGGDDFTGGVSLMGGKIGDGTNGGDDFAGSTWTPALDAHLAPSGDETPQ
jgi:hypothetical protein